MRGSAFAENIIASWISFVYNVIKEAIASRQKQMKKMDALIADIFSEDVGAQVRLAKVFENCLKSYSYKGIQGDKYYFEALYNCNKALKNYCDGISAKNVGIQMPLKNVIEYVKTLNLPELLSVWA